MVAAADVEGADDDAVITERKNKKRARNSVRKHQIQEEEKNAASELNSTIHFQAHGCGGNIFKKL